MTSEPQTYVYPSSKTFFWITLLVVSFISISGYLETRPTLDIVLMAASLATLIIGVVYLKLANTYLEIRDNRTIVNKGYREFGRDEMDIYDIKYVYRIPQFPIKSLGTIMVMYVKGDDDKLKHSIVREVNYTDKALLGILTKLKEINPRIELDPEYEAFLKKGESGGKAFSFSDSPTKNTKQSVEDRLREKWETW